MKKTLIDDLPLFSMAAQSARSRSSPSHDAEVPFQAIRRGFASARRAAASRIGASLNWVWDASDIEISTTRKRPKCAEAASPNGANMAEV